MATSPSFWLAVTPPAQPPGWQGGLVAFSLFLSLLQMLLGPSQDQGLTGDCRALLGHSVCCKFRIRGYGETPCLWSAPLFVMNCTSLNSCLLPLSLCCLFHTQKMCVCCCCSVVQSCLTVCDPMDCSTPGLPVPPCLLEFAKFIVHCIGDAVQPSHPLRPSSPSALNLSQHQGLFQ